MSYNPYQQTPSQPMMPMKADKDIARDKVRTPAILMIIGGILNTIVGVGTGVMMPVIFFGMREELEKEMANDPDITPELMELVINLYGWGGIFLAILSLICGVIVIMGAVRMLGLRSWGWALFAAILSVIPCMQSCWLLTLPIGIYVIIVLSDSRVKAAFE